jgi:hypothetical protein
VRFSALLLVLLVAPPVRAHALGVTATLRGDRIEVEAYYSDDTPARDARVTVRDHAGQVAAEGRTDDQGKWQFAAPRPGPYTVTVDAGAGHSKTAKVLVPAVLPPGPTGPIDDGPSRAEFTRFPCERVALGLAIIAVLAGGWIVVRRGVRRMQGPQ